MPLLTKAPRGTSDVLPKDTYKWQYIESLVSDTAKIYGFKEIRFPTFEHTELFTRSVGDTTDVVQKEMYTFNDKGDRSITLRPEGTACVVRSILESGIINDALPLKVFYITSCFRYEKPQAGRLREFHQFGVEMFGSNEPQSDAQIISLADTIFKTAGITNLRLEINSLGCPECRPVFQKKLFEYFKSNESGLCKTCIDRLEKNPLRIFDCKSPECQLICEKAPKGLDLVCEKCETHFEGVKTSLNIMGIKYVVNPSIVRGLDYYTNTVFEFISETIGAQGTVCGGGRYNGLLKVMGGQDTPAMGFAMGLERFLMAMDANNSPFPEEKRCDIYFASIGDEAKKKAFELTALFRDEGFFAECDLMDRSIKAQMKYANKIGAKYCVVIGDDEIKSGMVKLKNMDTGVESEVKLSIEILDALYDASVSAVIEQMTEEFKGQSL